jgi:hypothetical protein
MTGMKTRISSIPSSRSLSPFCPHSLPRFSVCLRSIKLATFRSALKSQIGIAGRSDVQDYHYHLRSSAGLLTITKLRKANLVIDLNITTPMDLLASLLGPCTHSILRLAASFLQSLMRGMDLFLQRFWDFFGWLVWSRGDKKVSPRRMRQKCQGRIFWLYRICV